MEYNVRFVLVRYNFRQEIFGGGVPEDLDKRALWSHVDHMSVKQGILV